MWNTFVKGFSGLRVLDTDEANSPMTPNIRIQCATDYFSHYAHTGSHNTYSLSSIFT